jgi:hypothetical protein
MDYLKRHLNDYTDATQKEPKAKRALILTLYDVLNLAETVEKEVKDKASFDALFDKSVSVKTKFTKALGELATHLNDANTQLNTVRNDRKKREKKPKATTGGGESSATVANVIVPDTRTSREDDPMPTTDKLPVYAGRRIRKMKITPAIREQIWKKYIGRVIDCSCPVCQTRLISMTYKSCSHLWEL